MRPEDKSPVDLKIDEQLERLIVRSIDGELSEEEQLSLDRELIRNPEARRLMDEYRSMDVACSSALDQWLDVRCLEGGTANQTQRANQTPLLRTRRAVTTGGILRPAARPEVSTRRSWAWLVPGAIAAALLAMIVPKPSFDSGSPTAIVDTLSPGQVLPMSNQRLHQGSAMHPVNGTPGDWTGPTLRRATGREYIGIVGDDGNLYWIEVERTRTLERGPNPMPQDGKFNEM